MHSWKMLVCCSGHLKQTHVDWDWCNLMQKVFCIICVGMGNNGKEERNCEMLTLCTCFLQLKIFFFYGFGSLCPLSWHFFFSPLYQNAHNYFSPPTDWRAEKGVLFLTRYYVCLVFPLAIRLLSCCSSSLKGPSLAILLRTSCAASENVKRL